ncbi:MAG: hypothetical protein ACO3JL_20025 [Myxococcota bacterium]
MSPHPPSTPITPAHTVAQLIAHDLSARRAISHAPERGAFLLEIDAGNGEAETWTVLWGPSSLQLLRGATVPPMVPWGALHTSEGALLALVRGQESAAELLATGRLQTRGDGRVLRAVAASLRPGQSWLAVQTRR